MNDGFEDHEKGAFNFLKSKCDAKFYCCGFNFNRVKLKFCSIFELFATFIF